MNMAHRRGQSQKASMAKAMLKLYKSTRDILLRRQMAFMSFLWAMVMI